MDIYELKKLSTEDRAIVLQGEAMEVEEGVYMRPLTDAEIREHKDGLAKNSIDQAFLLDELSEIKSAFKAKLEPIKEAISFSINAIKNQAVETKGKQFKIPDYTNQMVHIVDEFGNVILSRQMYPKERQYIIQPLKASNGEE